MTFHKFLGDSKMFAYDKYYRECKQQNKPFIKSKINPVHKNHLVTADLITCDYILSEPKQIKIQKLITDEINFVNSNNSNSFNDYNIDEELVWIDGVSSEHLDFLCNSLFDLIYQTHD